MSRKLAVGIAVQVLALADTIIGIILLAHP